MIVKAEDKGDYLRLFFYVDSPVKFSPQIANGNLKVTFNQNLDANIEAIEEGLGKYITAVDAPLGGKTLSFSLHDNKYAYRKFISEKFVGIDLIKKTGKERTVKTALRPPPEPEQDVAEKPVEQKPVVKVVETAELNLSKQFDDAGLGSQVFADDEDTEPKPEETANKHVENIVLPNPINDTEEIETSQNIKPENEVVKPAEVVQGDLQPEQIIPNNDNQIENPIELENSIVSAATNQQMQSQQSDDSNLQNQLFERFELTQNEVIQEQSGATKPQENQPIDNVVVPTSSSIPATTEPSKQIIVAKSGDATDLLFKWDEPVGSSVFKRGDYLWIVFDKYSEVNTNDIQDKSPDIVESAEQIKNKSFTILRIKIDDKYFATAYKDKDNWIISLTKQQLLPKTEPEINVSDSELHGSKIKISSLESHLKPIRLIDPTIGDEMIIIPLEQENSGYRTARKYPDFTFLQTYQGVSINLISDYINFATTNGQVEISGPTNKLAGGAQVALRELQETQRIEKERAEKLKVKGKDLTLVKFKTWKIGDEKSYNKDLKDLLWKITEVNWSQKSEQRLNLARFYFAHALYPEAIGVINTIKQFDKTYALSNDVKIVEAISLYMHNKFDESVGAFNLININELDEKSAAEIKLWKAAANLQLGNQIKIDKFISDNPVNEQKKDANKDDIDAGDEASNTKLIYETSSRLLKIIRKADPEFVNSDEIQKLESTARFVTDHYHEAIKRFEESDLYKSSDVFQAEDNQLWWSTSEQRRQEELNMDFVKNIEVFLKFYPDEVFNDFALIAIEDKLKKNDIVVAEEILVSLKEEKRPITKNSIEFLRGLFYAKDEESEKANKAWKTLGEDVSDRYNRTRAKMALTIYQLRKKEIKVSDAIDRLNNLRSSWRGGVLEFNILKMLGEFYMEEKKYMEGFTVWRSSIAAFPGSDESLLIAKKMSDKFVQIFSQGDVDKMPKLDALTLYYEFRELTPIGKLGDEIISRLADRLIEVDLLDRAAALLTHQVRFRLVGEERDATAIKLVKVHLSNRQPQQAFDVLNATENENISEELKIQRKYLKGQSLVELGRNNKALAVLKGDESQMASFLRADVYWRNKVWKKVVEELETPFREIRRDGRKVTQDEMNQLIKLSVAYALTGQKRKLEVLYEDFEPLVAESDGKKVFMFVATDRGPVDFRNLDQTVEFKDMDAFLNNYLKNSASAEKPKDGV